MLNEFLKKLKTLDQFGVPFQPKLDRSTSEYKTPFGGAMSIVMYGLSFAYLVYSLQQWGQGNLLPKITFIQTRADAQHISFENDLISIKPRSNDSINPFDPNALILMPLVLPFINNKIHSGKYFNFDQITLSGNSVSVKNLELQYGNDEQEIEQIIAFVDCQTQAIPSTFNCASAQRRKEFFDQSSNAFIITTYVNQFNTDKRALEFVGKEQVIALIDNSTYFQTTNFNIQESSVDTGFLFESTTNYEYAMDYYLTSQQLDMSYFNKQFSQNAYVVFQLRIGKLRYFQSIQYSKISEVLADAGSIISAIFLLSFIVIVVNQYLLNIKQLEEIIQIYYPKYKEYNIKKSIFGTIQSVSINGKSQHIEIFKEYQKQLYDVAEKKLTVLNQVYEISRLQFLVQNLLKSKLPIKHVHKIGIQPKRFDEKYDESNNQIIPMANLSHSRQELVIIENQHETISNQNQTDSDENGLDDQDFEALLKPEN